MSNPDPDVTPQNTGKNLKSIANCVRPVGNPVHSEVIGHILGDPDFVLFTCCDPVPATR